MQMQTVCFENPRLPPPDSWFGFFCDYCERWVDGLPALATPEGWYVCLGCASHLAQCVVCRGWFETISLVQAHCRGCAQEKGLEVPPAPELAGGQGGSSPLQVGDLRRIHEENELMIRRGVELIRRRAEQMRRQGGLPPSINVWLGEWTRRRQAMLENIKATVEAMPAEERALYDRFLDAYARCPVCGRKVETGILHRLFVDPPSFQKKASESMKAALKQDVGASFGIPCCTCFNKLGGKRVPVDLASLFGGTEDDRSR
jgi:hypothetical protein